MSSPEPLRIGILGAARIAPMALIRPARLVSEVEVTAIAARDEGRARKFAAKHGIPRVFPSYEALLEDRNVDAIYNPLPNGLHCEWTIRALESGKHVLCEKPIASNASEARQMADAAAKTGRELVEAFHWRYHPLATRVLEILADLGECEAAMEAYAQVRYADQAGALVADPEADLFAPFPHGSGQTLLREALLVADHNSYHIGQIVDLRMLLGVPVRDY